MSNYTVGSIFSSIRNGMNVKQSKDIDGLPITRIETISNGDIDLRRVGYAGLSEADSRNWLLEPGDILFSHINSHEQVGKCALYEGNPAEIVHGMNLLCLRSDRSILFPPFAIHLLRTRTFRIKLERFINKAVNQASVSISNLQSIEVDIPSLEVQKHIAAVLDQADALRRNRHDAISKLESISYAIFVELFGDQKTNSKHLQTTLLGDIIKVSSGEGLTGINQNGGEFPVYGGNGINGWHDRWIVQPNTIVIGRVGVYCGAVHVTDRRAWVTDNALIVKKLDDTFTTTYLAAALKYADLNQYAGRSAQPLVSGSRIYPVRIAMPSVDDQRRFEERIAEVARLRDVSKAHLTKLNALFASLQQGAFRGELTWKAAEHQLAIAS